MPHFQAAIAAGLPGAEPYLGMATCLGRVNDIAGAERALAEARRLEPDNPVVVANLGILQATRGDNRAAMQSLQSALASDPNLHEARFNLALVYARLGQRSAAAAAARDLLSRLPTTAPQRAEVQRLLNSLQ
jgi:Flp pilus assembly protein TadD